MRVTTIFPLALPAAFAFEVGQQVTTGGGFTIQGQASSWQPETSEYLGIPFAKPPVGDLRFRPPQKFVGDSAPIKALDFGFSCPTNVAAHYTKFPVNSTAHIVASALGQNGDRFGEDCLTLNVWTRPQVGEKKKAVMVWIYGGGFGSGNSDNPIYNGAKLANDYDVVLVSLNYRINIFGFPGLPGNNDQNLGLLDQRMAIEWVRDNIEVFGGDPERITLFGQSAGGVSVDLYSYAWTKDPIVNAFIPQSGTWELGESIGMGGNITGNWFKASQKLGCGGVEAGESTIACMQSRPWRDVLRAIHRGGAASSLGNTGDFGPSADGKVVFSDYAARAKVGNFIKRPILVGSATSELNLFLVMAGYKASAVLQGFIPQAGNSVFDCPATRAAKARADQGIPAYRYRWNGQFPNLEPVPGAGAYHAGEIPLIFGTTEYTWDYFGLFYNKPLRMDDTPAEVQATRLMSRIWTSFAKDPDRALTEEMRFPTYRPNAPTVIQIGGYNSANIEMLPSSQTDNYCSIGQTILDRGKNGGASKVADQLEASTQPGSFLASLAPPETPTTISLEKILRRFISIEFQKKVRRAMTRRGEARS